MLELARIFGAMLQDGWRPRRSIWLNSWDGEEQGLIGSTEQVEELSTQLSNDAVVYLNVDTAVESTLVAFAATPSLRAVLREVAGEVYDSRTNSTVLHNWNQQSAPLNDTFSLGSGSDFTPFFQHLGIPSVDFNFESSPRIYSTYHSVLDSFTYVDHWFPHLYEGMSVLLKVWGLVALKFSDSEVLPFNFQDYAIKLHQYQSGLEQQLSKYNYFPSQISLIPLNNAITRFAAAARAIYIESLQVTPETNLQHINNLNNRLMLAERDFLFVNSSFSLPGRPSSVHWYQHSIYAPGLYAGYAAEEFPGVIDAIKLYHDQPNVNAVALIQQQLNAIIDCIDNAALTLLGKKLPRTVPA